MKIAILTSYFYHSVKEIDGKDRIIFGGAERYLYELWKLLRSEGHDVNVYQPLSTGNKLTKTGQIVKNYKGMPVICIPNNDNWAYGVDVSLNMAFNEMSSYADLRIYFAPFLAYPYALKPAVSIHHGIYWDYPYYIYNTCNENERKEYFKRHFYGIDNVDVCVSVDSNVKKVVRSISPGAESRIRIIYNFVDTNKFTPNTDKKWEGLNIICPRRLTMLRGCNEFIFAYKHYMDIATGAITNEPDFKRLKAENPEKALDYLNKNIRRYMKYNFIFIGQASESETEKNLIDYYKNSPNISFVQKDMDDMPEQYRQADIAVIPTMACEGLSLSLLESMSCGLPVITTPVGGLGDAVIDNYNAFIYDPNHENMTQYIDYLADDAELRKKFGKRSREIAVECFDIEIWRQKWKNLLAQFGIVSEKQYQVSYESETSSVISNDNPTKSQKLVAMMLSHNEVGRYLEQTINNTLLFCDEIVILDDHSTDGTFENLAKLATKDKRIFVYSAKNSWDNEQLLREELLSRALERNPDWLIAIDSDEIYEADKINEQLPYIMSQTDAHWVAFRFFDMWDSEQYYRDDDIWPAGNYAPRMFRVSGKDYKIADRYRHCGSIPESVLRLPGMNSSVRVKHLGWMKFKDRTEKYNKRISEDLSCDMYSKEVYEAIKDPNPTLVKWDNNNPWQTSKLIIAYPPGMEWNVMQQRPHHLLKLAANERNRVFFGDDTALGTYECMPYLTIVNNWGSIKECDVLYITSPMQMDRCKHIRYKILVYDCCDWHYGTDYNLIDIADYVLCASKMLYDKVTNILGNSKSKKVIYLPNACDFEHFSKADNPSPEVVDPVIGYMGCIHPTMIDENIVYTLAEKYRILMIGQNKGIEFNHPNIYNAGHIKYDNLPKLISECTVCIIPFKTDSDYLKYSAPIKVWEYLAAGRPVVATPIVEVTHLADIGLIKVVENDDLDGWVKAVGEAINEYPNEKGREYAKMNTWEDRWKVLKQEVLNNIQKRRANKMDYLKEKVHKARKVHKCSLCGKEIAIGEKYNRQSGIYDGEFIDSCTCESCENIIDVFCLLTNEYEDYSYDCIKQWLYKFYCFNCKQKKECKISPLRCELVTKNFENLNKKEVE